MTTATIDQTSDPSSWELLARLSREQKKAAQLMSRVEGRFLVDQYYALQKGRLISSNRLRSMPDEPSEVFHWMSDNLLRLERGLNSALGEWAKQWRVGQWLQSICGIGPVISAGLLANLDIRLAPTAGHFMSFAGLVGGREWKKGEKRPWNAQLKTLVAYKLGESFVKVQNNKNDFYGGLFAERKAREAEANLDGKFQRQAAEKLEKYKIGKTTEAYKAYSTGFLPPAHIHARARRWVAKLFLSHLHEVMFEDYHGRKTADPYVFSSHYEEAHLHSNRIEPPNWPIKTGRPLKDLLDNE